MNYQPWLEFFAVLLGSVLGAYMAVRVTLARMEEKIHALAETQKDQGKRIERLEDRHFRAD